LGTKGSGQTPYSRRGDGRLTLLGGIREVLATSYLESLGVNTSKSMSLIETGEALQRGDEPSPTRSSVLVRLSHSHIRFGTFQRLAFFEQADNMEALVDYCCRHFYPDCSSAQELFEAVLRASANTVASWMAAGFVHGVMNTDNMNITGESFDYGPFRFLPTLKSNADHYRERLCYHIFRRLGLERRSLDTDTAFVLATFKYLEDSQMSWPQFWHDWQGGADQKGAAHQSPNAEFYQGDGFEDWYQQLSQFTANAPEAGGRELSSLLYEEIEALWAPIDQDDDWSVFHDKVKSFQA